VYNDKHLDYIKEYEKGIKKIARRTQRPRITKTYSLGFKNSWKNYDLFFSKTGRLVSSHFYKYNQENKIEEATRFVYSYSKDGLILIILGHDILTNTLKEMIECYYNDEKQIETEIVTTYWSYSNCLDETEYEHSYEKNYHKVTYTDSEDITFEMETWYDDSGKVIEEKVFSNEGEGEIHLWEKYEYDSDGELIKTHALNDQGVAEGETAHIEDGDKSITIYPGNNKMVWETHVEINKKGHWIRKTELRNGEPFWVHERNIEYY
jgi:hypothetical protein